MTDTAFVYVTYIGAPQEKVFRALLEPEFTRQYWGHDNVSDWKPGSPWEHREAKAGGKLRLVGKVIEHTPPRRLVITWGPPPPSDEVSRVTFDLETVGTMVKLTITHSELVPGSSMERGITEGWPRVLSSLKSLLETGNPLPTWAGKGQ